MALLRGVGVDLMTFVWRLWRRAAPAGTGREVGASLRRRVLEAWDNLETGELHRC